MWARKEEEESGKNVEWNDKDISSRSGWPAYDTIEIEHFKSHCSRTMSENPTGICTAEAQRKQRGAEGEGQTICGGDTSTTGATSPFVVG
jgi:hypothetical protein